jgi:hypothetical protein
MSKVGKSFTILIVAVMLVSSVGTTAFFFNNIVEDRNSKISSLESQIENQTSEIEEFNSQISNLKGQITNLTSANLETALGATEVPYNSPHNMPTPLLYNHLYITGSVKNTGKGTAYNAGLQVVAYSANGTLEIDMTVPLADSSSTFGTNLSTIIYGNGSLKLGNLLTTQTVEIDIGIFHEGAVSNWTITPVWTNSQ